jgi:hypothetical protein
MVNGTYKGLITVQFMLEFSHFLCWLVFGVIDWALVETVGVLAFEDTFTDLLIKSHKMLGNALADLFRFLSTTCGVFGTLTRAVFEQHTLIVTSHFRLHIIFTNDCSLSTAIILISYSTLNLPNASLVPQSLLLMISILSTHELIIVNLSGILLRNQRQVALSSLMWHSWLLLYLLLL